MKRLQLLTAALAICGLLQAQRSETLLEKNWKFINEDAQGAFNPSYNDKKWQTVEVPHDWAIYGPFDRDYDLQNVAVTQNFEKEASLKTGRTGGLPYVGIGWYRTMFNVDDFNTDDKLVNLVFDGAMSEARVYVNGKEAIFWPFGYNSFHCDVTDLINKDGKDNTIAVRLENRPQSSRWYPGAGLYRNVRVVTTDKVSVPVWGTYITTPNVKDEFASVKLVTRLNNAVKKNVTLETKIVDSAGEIVAQQKSNYFLLDGQNAVQNFIVKDPSLWSPETPELYTAKTTVFVDGKETDTYDTRFGIRTVEVINNKGFYLNGKLRQFKGVCNHHDLGPIGAAINVSALRHQLEILQDMGCDAIRTAHNMPAPELVELCDEMGFMMMIEPFDEWDVAKCQNGYHRYFNEWAEKDMINMLHQYRNNASVVMWSIGNEVPTQCSPEGYKVAQFLQDICHREDPTRPVTCGMDQVSCVLKNGFAAALDVPGFNYRVHRYEEAYEKLPQGILLGSETCSTVSSRGVYKFPVKKAADAKYDDNQCSSYDLEYCSWSNVPDDDFAAEEDYPWYMGQFVWTGFDYLGEPSPYDTDSWPNHSSMFGIIDLASLPKDRYYLYRSMWNKKDNTLHMLPHWTWPGRENEVTPVFVYTNYPEAELFVNGISQGKQRKNNSTRQNRFRLMWNDVVYQPGELKVIAYNDKGEAVDEKIIKTAGQPYQVKLEPVKTEIKADGKELSYVTVSIVDKDGNLCPDAKNEVSFEVKGAGHFRAVANGDATCLELFHQPKMHVFSGQMTMIVESHDKKVADKNKNKAIVTARSKGLKNGTATIIVK